MILSRKRLREATPSPRLRGPEELLAFKRGDPIDDHTDGKRLLRDLGGRDALLELLARLEDREPSASDAPPKLSRAHVSSQELFLSVVLEWQQSAESPTAAVFRHDRSFHSVKDERHYASSSEDEREEPKRSHALDDVSPTSVHHVPRATLPPLRLSDSPLKRIGIYTPRARQELLRKYMAKRARRLSQNKVRYGVRKTLANARPRVKGRFVKTETPLTAALVQQTQAPAP